MKRLGALTIALLVVIFATRLLIAPRVNSPKRTAIEPVTEPSPRETSTPPASHITGAAVDPASPAAMPTDLETVKFYIRDYRAAFGGNPVGNNADITKALLGANKTRTRFAEGARVNDRGELVDGWGTPYFFHAISAREMEIQSAGPDRQMWTADDIVLR
jgi:hypothetical protein